MSAPASIASDLVLEQSVFSASPEQLVDMVMDHVLLHLTLAASSVGKPWEDAQSHVHKAQRGLMVLQSSLSMPGQRGQTNASRVLSSDLQQLYGFMIRSLIQADRDKDLTCIAGIIKVMGNLVSGWKQGVMRQDY
jgi:flagellar biosynthetic protein FliS